MEISNFLFHRVSPEEDKLWPPMNPDLFEKCIKYISSKFTIGTIEDVYLNNEKFKNKRVATIGFDDGYLDNYIYALPILEKYNVKASFYVVTDCIDNGVPTWTHNFEFRIQHTTRDKLVCNSSNIPAHLRLIELDKSNKAYTIVNELKAHIKTLSHAERELILNDIYEQLDDVTIPNFMMSWDEVTKLKEHGHEIGSHSVTHSMLGTIEDSKVIQHELNRSKEIIENKVNCTVYTISYPIGSYNSEVIKLARENGYLIGLATEQRIDQFNTDNLFEINRIELYNESWFKTKLRINNQLEKIKRIIKFK